MLRLFLDTSAILAGLNSPTGAAGVILSLCIAGKAVAVLSPQIIEGGERIIPLKFPKLDGAWTSFLLTPHEIAPDPTLSAARKAYRTLPTNDAPILASALKAKPDALVTWNTRDFQRPAVQTATPFPIFTPGECLAWMRELGYLQ